MSHQLAAGGRSEMTGCQSALAASATHPVLLTSLLGAAGAGGAGGALTAGGPTRSARSLQPCEAHPRACSDGYRRRIQPAGLRLLAAGTMAAAATPAYRRPLPGERYAYGGLSCVLSAVITNPVDLVKIRQEHRGLGGQPCCVNAHLH